MALHWLPVRQRITYKLCTLMQAVMYGHGTQYLMDMVIGEVCVTTYRHVSSTFSSKEGFRYTAHSNYIRIEILFCCSCSSTGVESLDGWHSTALHRFLLQETSQALSVYDCIFLLAQHCQHMR